MNRKTAWVLLALYLLTVGLWPAAATPVTLALTGAAIIAAAIPGPAWLLAAGIAWLKHRPATTNTATA
ncbi:hypothetical protein [Streptomyces sp. bgisy154]|uniref:hypothetical protein n=1 Tax=Streptomyces sp. bgisy154 TaxID=3413794 RepID=UPI003D760CC9